MSDVAMDFVWTRTGSVLDYRRTSILALPPGKVCGD